MADSPYAPPRSNVEDVEPALPPLERPPRMTTALICVGLDYAVSVLGTLIVLVRLPLSGAAMAGASVLMFAILGLQLLVNLKLARGRNWARITYLVLNVLAVLNTLANFVRYARGGVDMPVLMPILSVLSVGLEAFVLWVLLTAPVRAWFHAMRGRD